MIDVKAVLYTVKMWVLIKWFAYRDAYPYNDIVELNGVVYLGISSPYAETLLLDALFECEIIHLTQESDGTYVDSLITTLPELYAVAGNDIGFYVLEGC